jgi:hypothetical protein
MYVLPFDIIFEMNEQPAVRLDSAKRASQSELDPARSFRTVIENNARATPGRLIVLSHKSTDLDAIASNRSMADQLQKTFPDKEVVSIMPDAADDPNSIRFQKYSQDRDGRKNKVIWANGDVASQIHDGDMVLMIDVGEFGRAGLSKEQADELQKNHNVRMLIVDHHRGESDNATDKYVEQTASSASELVVRMYGDELDPDTAKMLCLGISFDTHGLDFLRQDNAQKGLDAFAQAFKASGVHNIESIRSEAIPHLTRDEFALANKISLTRTQMKLEGLDDVVDYCFLPEGAAFDNGVNEKFIMEEVLDDFLFTGANFSIFLKPVEVTQKMLDDTMGKKGFKGKVGDKIWDIKMRANEKDYQIANLIGDELHRGGHGGAAKGEIWEPMDMESALKKIAEIYTRIRKTPKA